MHSGGLHFPNLTVELGCIYNKKEKKNTVESGFVFEMLTQERNDV